MTALCSMPSCTHIARARGWCSTHYTRWYKHGDPNIVLPHSGWPKMPPRPKMVRPPCKFPGCERLSAKSCKGWCQTHHSRWYRHGDPSVVKPSNWVRTDVVTRIRQRVVDEGGCLVWQGSRLPTGYGVIGVQNRSRYVHRLMWEDVNGAVPDGKQLHHICRNRACCNPDHLQALTVKEHRAAHRVMTSEAA